MVEPRNNKLLFESNQTKKSTLFRWKDRSGHAPKRQHRAIHSLSRKPTYGRMADSAFGRRYARDCRRVFPGRDECSIPCGEFSGIRAYDSTPHQDFRHRCPGKAIAPGRLSFRRIDRRKKGDFIEKAQLCLSRKSQRRYAALDIGSWRRQNSTQRLWDTVGPAHNRFVLTGSPTSFFSY